MKKIPDISRVEWRHLLTKNINIKLKCFVFQMKLTQLKTQVQKERMSLNAAIKNLHSTGVNNINSSYLADDINLIFNNKVNIFEGVPQSDEQEKSLEKSEKRKVSKDIIKDQIKKQYNNIFDLNENSELKEENALLGNVLRKLETELSEAKQYIEIIEKKTQTKIENEISKRVENERILLLDITKKDELIKKYQIELEKVSAERKKFRKENLDLINEMNDLKALLKSKSLNPFKNLFNK